MNSTNNLSSRGYAIYPTNNQYQTILVVVGGMSYMLQTMLVVGGMNSTNNLSSRGYVIYPKQS